MKPFLAALLQLDSPVPPDLQVQVNRINIPGRQAPYSSQGHSPLAKSYQAAHKILRSISEECGKGFRPNKKPEPIGTETDNIIKPSSFKEAELLGLTRKLMMKNLLKLPQKSSRRLILCKWL